MIQINIAVILTCFNRRTKTIACLDGLYKAQSVYIKKQAQNEIKLAIYLTDDGCTDGTADAVRTSFPDKDITILQGDGNLFWAGGMRLAWNEALKKRNIWDFYLLLNDDTTPMLNMFDELFEAHRYSLEKYKVPGVYSGVCCDINDPSVITYGGVVVKSKLMGTDRMILPSGCPQWVDKTNANILLVSAKVVDVVGIFYEGYQHGAADYDYSLHAIKKGYTAFITGRCCGVCERDHKKRAEARDYIKNMSIEERKKYFANPRHSNRDKLTSKRRNAPFLYPFVWISVMINEKCPRLFYFLDKIRGL